MSARRRSENSSETATSQPPKRLKHGEANLDAPSRAKRDKLLGGEQDGRRTIISDEEFREKNPVLKAESIGTALKVENVDLQKEKNKKAHNTDEYEQDDLIIRRGQMVELKVTFDRKVRVDQDIVVIQFSFGARPQESKGTVLRVPVGLSKKGAAPKVGWTSKVVEVKENMLTLEVTSEPDCFIGKYDLYVETKLKDSQKDFTRYEVDDLIIVLFNPWCKDDVVYVEDKGERFEYVLNDTGKIWIGSARCHRGRRWNFGQFDSPVLEVALGLLDKGELGDSGRNSVVSIIRCLTALANSMDEDEGLLTGRWTSEYPKGCTKPWEWPGSVAIIKQFHETGKSVEYGQCWVFSGVMTTLLRTLGVPTRSVTNFASAHDTDCSMTIDKHFDEDGEPLEDLDDSVWNFHVWNESFFKRLDLPPGYDGWQVHDATPQELSEGVMRCGPAPLKAIKEGHVYLNFDVGFVFAEVNGDKVQWKVRKDGSMEKLNIDGYSVGKNISTKAVGSDDRHDLTWDYKYPENSEEERKVVKFVNRFSTAHKKNVYGQDKKMQSSMELILPDDKVIGEDIELGVKITNLTSEKRNVKVRLTLANTFYTGVVGKKVMSNAYELTLNANEEKDVLMNVPSDDYEQSMNAEAIYKVTATCRDLGTDFMFAKTDCFTLQKPALNFDLPEKIPSVTDTTAKITFKNTTNLKLHNGVFNVEGSYLVMAKTYPIRKVIQPDEEVSVEVTMYAYRLGVRHIMATFSSDEMTDMEGEAAVQVISKSDWQDTEEMVTDAAE